MEIEHEAESDQEVKEIFIHEELTDWGRATYMAGLSSDTDKIDEKLCCEVVHQLNSIRAGLNKQQKGIVMQREALDKVTCSDTVFGHLTGRIEIPVLVELKYLYLLNHYCIRPVELKYLYLLNYYCIRPVKLKYLCLSHYYCI